MKFILLGSVSNFALPLQNPVLIFAIILFIILFAPIILNKFKIPHLIGLLIAGAVIGPNGFNLIMRDSSIILFGTVGLLYIMFLAGLEIDLAQFKKNSGKSIVFGLYTFIIPMVLGMFSAKYIFNFEWMTSVLLASMFASHTLIAYPIVSKLGITKNLAVNVTIGGTMITDTLALLVLAAIVGMAKGTADSVFWIKLSVSVLIFGIIIIVIFPIIARWFFKSYDDNISQYIFVLGLVFLGAFIAEAAGIEAIIGAFLVGLSLNRLIPHTSPLMNRIDFVGNALFIPFFLIGVGMLIDYQVFFNGYETIEIAIYMSITATVAKFLAAWLTQKTFKFTLDERRIIFGLSNAQAAATLAAVLVGYNIVLNQPEIDAGLLTGQIIEPIRLLNESILNGTILMILVTCTIASFITQKGAQNIAISESANESEGTTISSEKILVTTNNIANTEELINLSLTIKSKNNKDGLYALTIIADENINSTEEKGARKILDKAVKTASAADIHLVDLLRYDINTVNGINNIVKHYKITDLILGVTAEKGISSRFLGNLTDGILTKCNSTTFIYKSFQPLSTIRRHLIFIPDRAEKEIGFPFWIFKLWNIAKNSGAKLIFYSSQQTLNYIKDIQIKYPIEADFMLFDEWEDFLVTAREIKANDGIIIIMSRKDRVSYHNIMAKIPNYLNKYFENNNYLLVFPTQAVDSEDNMDLKNPSVLQSIEKLDDISKTLFNLFKRK